MNNKKINAEIIADSVNENGNRITTFVLTYPRIIHAELLTHRLFSRNAASSRAIPSLKMIADVRDDMFFPVAFQKPHSGMQGTEYLEGRELAHAQAHWEEAGLEACDRSEEMYNVSKQLTNRILEPYQWYTCIVTATEYDNFFELRCPQYQVQSEDQLKDGVKGHWRSRKEATEYYEAVQDVDPELAIKELPNTIIDWLKLNKGQGEIHISLLAEAMWDAMNESKPKQLKAGEWHIPFGDKMDMKRIEDVTVMESWSKSPSGSIGAAKEAEVGRKMLINHKRFQETRVKIATARCARVSYLNFEGKDDYEADLKLYDILKSSGHFSPFEHCARAMDIIEYKGHVHTYVKGGVAHLDDGWSGNFRGFVQLRKEIE
jgi:thymidylate synthase ThyX